MEIVLEIIQENRMNDRGCGSKFQDSEAANTKTQQNNITKLTNWAIKLLKQFNSDKCKVMHVVVVRITFPMVHFHWIEIGHYQ